MRLLRVINELFAAYGTLHEKYDKLGMAMDKINSHQLP
jgi:hypothetical protein